MIANGVSRFAENNLVDKVSMIILEVLFCVSQVRICIEKLPDIIHSHKIIVFGCRLMPDLISFDQNAHKRG